MQAPGYGPAGVRIPICFHEGVQHERISLDKSDRLDTALNRNVAENEDHSARCLSDLGLWPFE